MNCNVLRRFQLALALAGLIVALSLLHTANGRGVSAQAECARIAGMERSQ